MSIPINKSPQQLIFTWIPSNNRTWIVGTLPAIDSEIQVQIPEENKKNSDGCICRKCQEFFPYAEPNQEDGSMICYGCRMTW